MTGIHRGFRALSSLSAALAMLALVALGLIGASAAHAEGAWWRLTSGSRPAYMRSGGEGMIVVSLAMNEVQEILRTEGEFEGKEVRNLCVTIEEDRPHEDGERTNSPPNRSLGNSPCCWLVLRRSGWAWKRTRPTAGATWKSPRRLVIPDHVRGCAGRTAGQADQQRNRGGSRGARRRSEGQRERPPRGQVPWGRCA
jgi:hypothetical protein